MRQWRSARRKTDGRLPGVAASLDVMTWRRALIGTSTSHVEAELRHVAARTRLHTEAELRDVSTGQARSSNDSSPGRQTIQLRSSKPSRSAISGPTSSSHSG